MRPRIPPALAATLAGAAAFVYMFLATGAIENDHFVILARAHQVLYGDWPVRDFEDPGMPLTYLLSSAAAAVFGPTLLVNVVLSIAIFGVTVAVTYFLVRRVTGSSALAVLAAAVTIAVYPRLYNTTKVVVPVVALALAWAYAAAPTRTRIVAMALWTAVAFLMRHDYAIYVAASNVVLLALWHRRRAAAPLLLYGALVSACVAPWLVYVQWNEGLAEYLRVAIQFTAAEGRRTASEGPQWPFYVMSAIPVVALAVWWRERQSPAAAPLAAAAVLLLAMDMVFLRDVIGARLPDVIAPSAIVAAALIGRLVPHRGVSVWAMVAAAVVLVVVAAPALARVGDVFNRAFVVAGRLRTVSPDIQPVPARAPLITFLQRCTSPSDRVLVAGFGPEIPVLSHRAFASGLASWIPGYYEDPRDIARAIGRLERERVGAVILLDGPNELAGSWPPLDQWVRRHGFEEHAVPAIDARLRVWLPPRSTATIDRETMLPCAA